MQRMSGVPPKHRYCKIVEGTKTQALTLKDNTGIRLLEKWAVKIAGQSPFLIIRYDDDKE